jgi:DMSO reductase anchor subunit
VSDVTRDGLRGVRPGREATTGAYREGHTPPDGAPAGPVPGGPVAGDGHHAAVSPSGAARDGHAGGPTAARPDAGRRPGRRGRRGEESVVGSAEFTSYYGRPVLNGPNWEATNIAGYFFLGGLAGASSVLAAGADLTGRPTLARRAKYGALAAIGLSTVALIRDLGRPSRFPNMLRVLKPTSPMSVGSWLLSGYGPAAGAAALSAATGLLPGAGRAATAGAAALGPAIASYTAVLIADTAVPTWHEGYRELPFVFTGSAAAAAGGLGMIVAPVAEAGPARRAAAAGAALELAAGARMESRLGMLADPYRQGAPAVLTRAARVLTAAGALGGLLLGRRSRTAAVASGAALLAGSALTRFGVFAAGVASARDPRYTVVPQRERLARAAAATTGEAAREPVLRGIDTPPEGGAPGAGPPPRTG